MHDHSKTPKTPAPVEQRVAALEQAFEERNLIPAGFIDDFTHVAQEDDGVFEGYLEKAP